MNRNVAVFETDYNDSDFKITWNKIKQVSTTTQFLVTNLYLVLAHINLCRNNNIKGYILYAKQRGT